MVRKGWILLSVTWMLALACIPRADAVKLRYKVQQGDTWTRKVIFKATGTINADLLMDVSVELVSKASFTVNSVDADGLFRCTVDPKIEKVNIVANGQAADMPPITPPKPVVLTVQPDGKIVSIEDPEGGVAQLGVDPLTALGLAFPLFPEGDLKPGDTWEATPNLATPMKITGTLVALKEIDGKQKAEVQYVFAVGSEAFAPWLRQLGGANPVQVTGVGATGTLTTALDLASGIPDTANGSGAIDLRANAGGFEIPISLRMELEVKDKDEG